jgi:hypothetical protein
MGGMPGAGRRVPSVTAGSMRKPSPMLRSVACATQYMRAAAETWAWRAC